MIHPFELLPAELIAKCSKALPRVSGIAQDVRRVAPGTLYFAVSHRAGTQWEAVTQAVTQGAVLVALEEEAGDLRIPAILVRNTREALAHAASRWYGEPSKQLQVVGITGTNGKTTTSYLLRKIWQSQNIKSGILGTVEYHIGDKTEPASLTTPDPLTLQPLLRRMVDEEVKVVAIEVSSIGLDQHRVTATDFAVAVFTNLTQDHLDYHSDIERYYKAKRKLFIDLAPKAAMVNIDDPMGKRLFEETIAKEKLSFSTQTKDADFHVTQMRFSSRGTEAAIVTPAGEFRLQTPLIGKHNLYNCLAALGSTFLLGQDLKNAVAALSDATGAPGRLERVTQGPDQPHVFVDYAHTDDALYNVLKSLNELRTGTKARIITVFGCGGDRDKGKRPKMADIASKLSEVTIATSDNPRTEDPQKIIDDIEPGIRKTETEYHREVNRLDAIHLALKLATPSDIVLIAGKGHEDYQIIGKEKHPFDDRKVVREYYDE